MLLQENMILVHKKLVLPQNAHVLVLARLGLRRVHHRRRILRLTVNIVVLSHFLIHRDVSLLVEMRRLRLAVRRHLLELVIAVRVLPLSILVLVLNMTLILSRHMRMITLIQSALL